jgi:glycosyltransferase involved in cell wall biosynthesis
LPTTQASAGSRLAIMGSGRLEASLKDLARELNVAESVLFLGQVPGGRRFFRAFDVFALTSDHEPFGMVLLEAMAAGVPVIGSDCGGGREVLEGVGVLFPLADAAALAAALRHMAELDDEQRALCASLMLQRLETHFSDRAVRETFWGLEAIIAERALR